MLSIGKSFEILPKHNGHGFISESIALNWSFYTINVKKCYSSCNADLN